MECRLTRSDGPWKCQVLLRFERSEDETRLNDVREVRFGPLLTNEGELEGVLKRAQLAILNPSVESERFVDLDLSTVVSNVPPLGSRRQLSFSSNVVCLDVTSPLLTDLSFIDLPGELSS